MGFEEHQKQSPIKKNMVFKFHFHVPHLHILHHHHVPKGCVAIMVGHEGDEQGLHRFVVPLMFLSHPLFLSLLKEAEEEYGFKQSGPITIPCRVDEFKHVQEIIDEEIHRRHSHGNGHNNHNHQHHHNNNHHLRCF
jgi:SAUR family protein